MSANLLQPTQNRIEVIDAFRGFALAGIVLVHMVEQYYAGAPPEEIYSNAFQGIPDNIVSGFLGIFFQGKFFALFSILFGLSFFIQMDRAAQKGVNFTGRFLWRITLLLAIGYAHSLFYRGDILTIYAMVAIFLIPFYRVPEKWLIILAAIIFLGVGRYIVFSINGSDPLFENKYAGIEGDTNLAYFNILKNGTIWEVFQWNGFKGHLEKWEFQFSIFNRGYLTLGFFLIGLWMGKIKLFHDLETKKKKLRKALFWFIGGFFVSGAFTGLMFSQAGDMSNGFQNWWSVLGLTGADLTNISMTGIILCGFLLLYLKPGPQRFFNRLTAYGRTALTNYFLQSVIGTFIFFGWGLGLIGELRNIYTFGIAIVILILQVAISSWWLKNFKYGPLEWLWRSLTYFKWQPFFKTS